LNHNAKKPPVQDWVIDDDDDDEIIIPEKPIDVQEVRDSPSNQCGKTQIDAKDHQHMK
jgi:electron transfer flavoprotein alpha/beta subunit